jgi:hypothetical protein
MTLFAIRLNSAAQRRIMAALFAAFVLAGVVESFRTGLTWDEGQEQKTVHIVAGALQRLAHGDVSGLRALESYSDRYYGIGFHALAVPVQWALGGLLQPFLDTDLHGARLLAKHPVVFLTFALSVLIVYRLLRIVMRHRAPAAIFAAAYALYPYLLGHGLQNTKDMPYLAAYLLCTYVSVRTARHRLCGEDGRRSSDFIALLIATGWLVSIRIPGLVMIMPQYLVTFALADRLRGRMGDASGTPLLRPATAGLFLGCLMGLTLLTYPAFWTHPIAAPVDAVMYMSHHPNPTCTLTWGRCVDSHAVSPAYIPEWLVVKLPLMVLAGLMVALWKWRQMLGEGTRRVVVVTLITGAVLPVAVLIAMRANLYDETRHVLFIYPMLFMLGCIGLYALSRPLAVGLALLSLPMFVWDQVELSPYQYAYFNEAARFLDIDRLFETDYWAASAREVSKSVNTDIRAEGPVDCVWAEPLDVYQPFIREVGCVRDGRLLDDKRGPGNDFIIAVVPRVHRPTPGCQSIGTVTRHLALSRRQMTMAGAYRCVGF